MPSRSSKQAKFMAMCSHSPERAKGKCPPAKVSREFNAADKKAGILKGKAGKK